MRYRRSLLKLLKITYEFNARWSYPSPEDPTLAALTLGYASLGGSIAQFPGALVGFLVPFIFKSGDLIYKKIRTSIE